MEKDIKNTITDIKQSIRHLVTLGVPTRQIVDAIKTVEEELKESEDERIRKTLMAVVNLYYGEGEDEEKTACLYWLEKQGEYKKFRDSIQVGDKVTRNEEGVLINLSQLNRVAKKQGEQKPAEWSEEDKKRLSDIIVFVSGYATKEVNKEWVDFLKSLRPQKQWKAVDKEIYVKEPVLAQRKDKSEPNHGYVICYDHTLTPDVYERFIMISDIYYQSHWKPTEEQINALSKVLQYYGDVNQNAHNVKKLLEQLKAL